MDKHNISKLEMSTVFCPVNNVFMFIFFMSFFLCIPDQLKHYDVHTAFRLRVLISAPFKQKCANCPVHRFKHSSSSVWCLWKLWVKISFLNSLVFAHRPVNKRHVSPFPCSLTSNLEIRWLHVHVLSTFFHHTSVVVHRSPSLCIF